MSNAINEQAALAFVRSQSAHIEQQVNKRVYPDIQYPLLTPVDTSAHPFAQTVVYYSSDKFGKADWINSNSDDIPLAGTEKAEHKTSVYMAGIGYGYGYGEVENAKMLGVQLKSDDAEAARRAYEEFVDEVALRGDKSKGFNGFINYPDVTVASANKGNWGTATEDEILKDINEGLMVVKKDTKYTSLADTLLLPHEKLNLIATMRLGDTQTTVLEFLRRNNTYTATTAQSLTIRAVRGLEKAGTGNISRMIAYRRDPGVLKLHIPMPHRFLPVFRKSPLNYTVPGIFRLGGLDIRRPREVSYIDGI